MTNRSYKRRSAWLLSMLACAAFLLMAVNAYDISSGALLAQLQLLLVVVALVLLAAASMVLAIALWRYWRKRGRR